MSNALYMLRLVQSEDSMLAKSIEILDRQVNHMVRMVDDLMDVARLERGKVVLQKQRVDLNNAVGSAVESCFAAARAKGHRISVSFHSEAVPVEADPVRLEQIVCNLVNNAIKFTPHAEEIRVSTAIEGGFAQVSVTDRGIGFRPEEAAQLFEPFTQVNPTLARTAGGLGMGLTIVQRLAELHGGSASATSAGPGKGSRFVVRIPLAGGAEASRQEAPRMALAGRGRRVVVVEDNPDIRESLHVLMRLWGHEVAMAGDGRDGVALVLEKRPEIALIDIGLPGMNGYEVARAIRKRFPNGEIRLIAVTGYGQPTDRELAMQAGFDRHLLKPIKPEVLQQLLSE
jgi:CheY-like chemotaxis protein/two-component sensor histidine kinase